MNLDDQPPAGWQKVTVDDVKAPCKGSVVSGPFGSNIGKRFFVDVGVPLIRGNNLTLGDKKFIDDGFVFITEEKAHELRNCEALPCDLIFTAAGTLGQVGIIPNSPRYPRYIISNKQLRLRCDLSISLPMYLYYWFSSRQMRQYIINQNTGASVPLITLGHLRSFPIFLPPLPTQRKITAILSTYDDLIENNTRRIRILEEMAQMIYREWFVNFHFPGHEKVKMVDSELGLIPEGWEVSKFSDLVKINPAIETNRNEEKPYVEMAGLSTTSMVIEWKEIRTRNSGSKFENGDTIFPRITPCVENGKGGFVQFLPEGKAGLGSTEFIVLRSVNLCPEYVYFTSRESSFRENAAKSMIGASGRQRVQNQCFANYWVAKPPKQYLEMFSETVSPMFKEIRVLAAESANLHRTRDLLVPRLISGELDIEKLDIDVGGSVHE
jgi:type I restriction enzyme S subunit